MTQQFSRRGILRVGSVGVIGTALFGTAGEAAAAQHGAAQPGATRDDLRRQFHTAAVRTGTPVGLLLAIGYVNTRLEMPSPAASRYRAGDPEGIGSYGVMALVRNPSEDTLGLAAELTGIPVDRLVMDQRANILGGAALLAHSQGDVRPEHPRRWLGAVAGHGGRGPRVVASSGIGSGEVYADQVAGVLDAGFAIRTSRGEHLALAREAG